MQRNCISSKKDRRNKRTIILMNSVPRCHVRFAMQFVRAEELSKRENAGRKCLLPNKSNKNDDSISAGPILYLSPVQGSGRRLCNNNAHATSTNLPLSSTRPVVSSVPGFGQARQNG